MLNLARPLGLSLFAASIIACSDPEPPTAQGAATFRTVPSTNPPPSTGSCVQGPGSIYATEPFVEGDPVGEPQAPSLNTVPTKKGGPVYDGEEGNEITCTLSGAGPYELTARLEGPNLSLTPEAGQEKPTKRTNISIDATIDAEGKGTGTVSFYTTDLFDVSPSPDKPCTISVVPDPSTGAASIGEGAVWLTFDCPETRMSSMVSACTSAGTIVLEGCRK